MTAPEDLRYTEDHEWLRADGQIGITAFAQDQLGDVVFVELPEVGRELKKGEAFGVVESVKSVSDLFSPVSGKIAKVNQELVDHPELINQDPYGAGWIIALEGIDAAEASSLMDASAYESHQEGGH
ncbi:MAG: glycine cleavage system protein GcvH [Thermaerobacter sp.]|nr:glycine cleavage system protein GcvH [Thermaerobacter sp.]